MIVVQRIVTTWSKKTRGAQGREARARLPKAYPLPNEALVLHAFCIRHNVSRSAYDDYRTTEHVEGDSVLRVKPGISPTSLVMKETEGGLEVSFVSEGDAGEPRRHAKPMLLALGTWGCARYNGRFLAFDDPWYEAKIVNVAYGMSVERSLFTRSSMSATLDAEVDLW